MGLDMYLKVETYMSGYSFHSEQEKAAVKGVVEAAGLIDVIDPETPSVEVTFTAAYWRKANQIHKWFVDNVQDGVDECEPHTVTVEQLKELRAVCLEVLGKTELVEGMVHNGTVLAPEYKEIYEPGKVMVDSRVAREKLPTASGFFFGSTDYDEWYTHGVQYTVEAIDKLLAWLGGPDDDTKRWVEIKYQSSW